MGWLNLIDGILIILLVATIFCAVSLSRRLSSLRSDKKNLEKLMGEFHHISEKADKSLTGIRATAEEVSRELAEANAKSRSMRDELAFLVERADRLAEKIATNSNDLLVGKEADEKSLDNEPLDDDVVKFELSKFGKERIYDNSDNALAWCYNPKRDLKS